MEVMAWVAKLNDVPPTLLAQREAIKAKMLEALDLELNASVLRTTAERGALDLELKASVKRGEAYREALELTSRLGSIYPEKQIQEAQAA